MSEQEKDTSVKDTSVKEVIDSMAREGLKRVHGANLEYKGKIDFLASELEVAKQALNSLKVLFKEPMYSPQQDKLWSALSKAKADMAKAALEKTGHANTFGAYATVDDLRLFIDPILARYNLSFVLMPVEADNKDYVKYRLSHDSGQYTSEICRVNVDYSKSSSPYQAYGSALTYLKKQVYGAFFMLHIGGEKD